MDEVDEMGTIRTSTDRWAAANDAGVREYVITKQNETFEEVFGEVGFAVATDEDLTVMAPPEHVEGAVRVADAASRTEIVPDRDVTVVTGALDDEDWSDYLDERVDEVTTPHVDAALDVRDDDAGWYVRHAGKHTPLTIGDVDREAALLHRTELIDVGAGERDDGEHGLDVAVFWDGDVIDRRTQPVAAFDPEKQETTAREAAGAVQKAEERPDQSYSTRQEVTRSR